MKAPFISAILLAGGLGKRMQSPTPKQYIQLKHQPLALHSLEILKKIPEICEIIVVCDPAYQSLFQGVRFAAPGFRRQDSVYNGLQEVDLEADLVCIHDAARPNISTALVRRALEAGFRHGAATVGMPVKHTLKEMDVEGFVRRTLDRSVVWEIQTPQVIRPDLLRQGFSKVIQEGLTVTDDVSLVELLGHPVKVVEGSYGNLKITVAEDLLLAEMLIRDAHGSQVQL